MKKAKVKIVLAIAVIISVVSGGIAPKVYAAEKTTVEVKQSQTQGVIPIEEWKGNNTLIDWVCYVTEIKDIEKVTYDDIAKITFLEICDSQEEMPEILGKFTSLTRINLTRSLKVEDALKAISNIKGLKELDVSSTKILDLTTIVKNFPNLESLNISNNPYGEIPYDIFKLSNLESFSARNCGINSVPGNISKLTKLKYLSLGSNNISNLPNKLYEMQSLRSIYLDENNFSKLPKELFKINKLEYLSMAENKILEIPQEVIGMKGDRRKFELDVRVNQITKIPDTDGQTIYYQCNFVPMRGSGLSVSNELKLNKAQINVNAKEKISDAELENLVKVSRYSGTMFEYEDALDSRYKLEFVIDNKVVTAKELSKLPIGEYKAKVKIEGTDLSNTTTITKESLNIKVI